MRKPIVLTLAALMLLPAVPAWAQPCPFPMVLVCPQAQEQQTRPPRGPRACHCENPPGSPTWGGKAEIHKKNVPTVRPNRTPGPND